MSQTVKDLANITGKTPDELLAQLAEAGIEVNSADDEISESARDKFLAFLSKPKSSGGTLSLKKKGGAALSLNKKSATKAESKGTPLEEAKRLAEEQRRKAEKERQSELLNQEKAKAEAKKAEESRVEELKRQAEVGAERARLEKEAQEKKVAKTPTKPVEPVKQDTEEEPKAKVINQEKKKSSTKLQKQMARESRSFEEEESIAAGANLGGLHALDRRGNKQQDSGGNRRRQSKPVSIQQKFQKPIKEQSKEIEIVTSTVTVGELAQKLAIKSAEVVKTLMGMGMMATINQPLDHETIELVVDELGHKVNFVSEDHAEEALLDAVDESAGESIARPPVVTVMGHVDHGKTSLLDYIRNSRVVSGEAGGITQHVGAYHVKTKQGIISFLDTPGHAAFTAMRARGAQLTDVVILVVAADDGVMPQTKEAIQHAKAAGVPLIVAVNKVDKPEADADRVRNELVAQEVIPEDWGGDHMFFNVSAKTGEGIEALLEGVLLQSEVLELAAPVEGYAKGVVVEASLEKGRGPVATVLVTSGTLQKGDIILAGQEYGRVRALLDEDGKQIKSAGPSMPAVILGLSGAPAAGDDLIVVKDDKTARELAEQRLDKARQEQQARQKAAKLDQLFNQMGETDEAVALNIMLKADVQGSAEALRDSLTKLATDEVKVNVVSAGVGGISESDINLALASEAIVIGFNVRAEATARKTAEESGLELRYYSIIYEVIDDVKAAMGGLLSPELQEKITGLAEVRDVFKSPKLGAIAGCMVVEGTVKRGNPIRVLRDNVVIYEGELESLRRFKDDANEVRNGMECGIGVKNYNDVKVGDQIEVFERIEVARTID